ncbi:MAG: hypothetical protein SFV81_18310 [Pirellulaceae bacterium]|nr:hypothetical protein [Pirellulaceae bacterium]
MFTKMGSSTNVDPGMPSLRDSVLHWAQPPGTGIPGYHLPLLRNYMHMQLNDTRLNVTECYATECYATVCDATECDPTECNVCD